MIDALSIYSVRGNKRAEKLVVQICFENLMSFKNMLELDLFMRRDDFKRALIESNTSRFLVVEINSLYNHKSNEPSSNLFKRGLKG